MAKPNENEKESIRKEVERVLKDLGVSLSKLTHSKLTPEEFRKLHGLAIRVINGDIDQEEIADLPKEQATELSEMIQHIISQKKQAPLRDIQERNPYYNVFTSKIVRDGEKEES